MHSSFEQGPAYFDAATCNLDDFKQLTSRRLSENDVKYACDVQKNIPIYDMPALASQMATPDGRRAVLAEWAHVFRWTAGVIVLKQAYTDTSAIDEASAVYAQIIAEERASGAGSGDHFAKPGANDRVWNSLQKLCLKAPDVFARYFSNTAVAAASEAWLGSGYQMTAQVNLVHPGGAAQTGHRDFHLGFQSEAVSANFPAHVHDLSPVLTLQGAIAHCDMPLESGPTKLLPFSQAYRPGYAAYRLPEFQEYFEQNHVQLPLNKGDCLFFNPALFHAAGANTSSDIQRMANLLQVSSCMGIALEAVDRYAMTQALYPVFSELKASGQLDAAGLSAAIAASADGYSFPTNLDTDPPVGGMVPETQNALVHRALDEGWDAGTFNAALAQQAERRKP